MANIYTLIILFVSTNICAYTVDLGLGGFNTRTDRNLTSTSNHQAWSGIGHITIKNTLFSNFNALGYYESSLTKQSLRNDNRTNFQELILAIHSKTSYLANTLEPTVGLGIINRKNQTSGLLKRQAYMPIKFDLTRDLDSNISIKLITGYDLFFFYPDNNVKQGFRNIKDRYHLGTQVNYRHGFVKIEYLASVFNTSLGYSGPYTRGLSLSSGVTF